MLRDTKIDGCTGSRGHPETSALLLVSPVFVGATQNESNETLRPLTSSAATETDEEDYETSSEGPIPSKLSCTEVRGAPKESLCGYCEEESTSLSKLAALDGEESPIKREVIPDPRPELVENRLTRQTACAYSLLAKSLAKSKSLPILVHGEASSDASVNLKATDDALMSESSIARKKKMSTIVERMGLLMLPCLSMVSVTTDSASNFQGEQYEAGRLEEKMTPPVLRDATSTMINDERSEARVTLHETRSNHHAAAWDFRQTTIPTSVNHEAAASLTNEGDLANIAKNSYSPVKSVDFLPNPPSVPGNSIRLERGRRVSTDVNALLNELDHELGPLRCQLSEIVGKARALGLNGSSFDLSDRSAQSLSASGGFLDLGPPSRPATASCSFENRSGLVGKTITPSATFSVVDKPAPGEARTSWLSENGSSRQRQEALSFALGDSTRALERLNSPVWSSGRLSVSYLPSDVIRASKRGNLLSGAFGEHPRDEYTSDGTFQPRRKSFATIEQDMFAWKAWSAHSRVHVNRSSLLYETDRRSRDCLHQDVGNSQVSSANDSPEVQRNTSRTTCRSNYTSKSTVVIDANWSSVGRKPASKRSIGRSGVLVHARNSVATQVELGIRGGNRHRSTQTETERVAEDGRVSWPINLRWVDRGVGFASQIPRAVSAAVCASRIRVVSVNTEFHAAVEKRYTSRAVSPIRNSRARYAPVVSSSDVLLATVSGVFVQQVRELPEVARSPAVRDEKSDIASLGRDPHPRKFDSRLSEDTSELCEAEEDEVILPAPYPKFAISRCTDEARSRLNHQIVQMRSGRTRSPPKGANETSPTGVSESYASACLTEEELSNEKRQEARELSVSRVSRSGLCAQRKNRSGLSATSVSLRDPKRPIQARISRSTRLGRKAREYRKPTGAGVVVKAIPGMRSSPEDFFCDT